MNLAELVGIVYLAFVAGGTTANDAFIAMGIVVAWIVIGVGLGRAQPGHARTRSCSQDPRAVSA